MDPRASRSVLGAGAAVAVAGALVLGACSAWSGDTGVAGATTADPTEFGKVVTYVPKPTAAATADAAATTAAPGAPAPATLPGGAAASARGPAPAPAPPGPVPEAPAPAPPAAAPPPPNTTPAGLPTLTAEQRRRADQLVSAFENSTITIQYGYAERLGDGRGITAGRAGFTSGTGDLVIVVERYVAARPGTALAAFLPRLRQLAAAGSGDTSGLDGFEQAWAAAAGDATMRAIQDGLVDELYFVPAMRRAKAAGVTLPLSLAALFDTAIQHGDGGDPDSLGAIVAEANRAASAAADQRAWLDAFLTVRRNHLAHAADPSTRAEWAESVGRVDALRSVLAAGNVDIAGPLTISVYGDTFVIS